MFETIEPPGNPSAKQKKTNDGAALGLPPEAIVNFTSRYLATKTDQPPGPVFGGVQAQKMHKTYIYIYYSEAACVNIYLSASG